MCTGRTLTLLAIFSILFFLLGISDLLEGEIGSGVFWIYVGIGIIPEENIFSRMLIAKYLAIIFLGVLGFVFEMKIWMRIIMVIGSLAAAIELYRHIKRMLRRFKQ